MATLSSPTIEELIIDTRNLLNQPNASNSFWTDEELTSYLNEGARRYFMEAVQHAEGEFTTTANLDITSDSETIALPADCFKVKQLLRKVNNGYEPLFYRNNLTEGVLTQNGGTGALYTPAYHFRGNSLVLEPTPNFSETAALRLEYIQFPTTLVGGGDTLSAQISPVFRDLIVMYTVYKAKQKESLVSGTNTYAAALENLNDLFTAFKEVLQGRSLSPTAIIPFNPEEF